jgi:hypothetical protein
MKNKIFALAAFLFTGTFAFAQNVGINATGTPPNNSAMLDIDASNKGLLIPRVALTSATDSTTISSPATSLLVYNTGTGGLTPAGYYYWDGSKWVKFLITGTPSSDAWLTTGNSGTNPGTNFLGTTDANDLLIKTNNIDRIRIMNDGITQNRIGVGTNFPTQVVPSGTSTMLHIHDAGTTVNDFAQIIIGSHKTVDNSFLGVINFAATQTGGERRIASLESHMTTAGANPTGDLRFFTTNVGAHTEKMRIIGNGNVGIGTTTPGRLFEVSINQDLGHIQAMASVIRMRNANNATCATDKAWDFRVGNCGQLGLVTYNGNGNPVFNILQNNAPNDNSTSSAGIVASFNTSAPLSSFFLTNTGNIGIGLSNPSTRLQIYETAADINIVQFTNATTGAASTDGLVIRYSTSSGAANAVYDNLEGGGQLFFSGGVERFRITATGTIRPALDDSVTCGTAGNRWKTIFATNGTINTSDIRYKKDIAGLSYGLNEVMQLKPVSYKWKNKEDVKLGFIAQDLINIIPEVVFTGDDENKTLGVYYSDIIPVLTKAIQEQQAIIESQKNEIERLKKKSTEVDNLKAEIEFIKSQLNADKQSSNR